MHSNPVTTRANALREALGRWRLSSWLIGGAEGEVSHTLRQGLVAALMIMVGSWGVGWLVTVSGSFLATSPLLMPLRVTAVGAITCSVLVVVGTLLLLRSWLRLPQRLGTWEPSSVSVMYKALLMWGTPLVLCVPIFSRDTFSYLVQGGVLAAGMNPYESGVSELPGWFATGADSLWAQSPSPYGPLFLLIAEGTWVISGGVPDIAFPVFRVLGLFGVALMALMIPRLATVFGSQPGWALWLCLLNPLSLIVFIAAAHNDALMIALMLAGAYYAHQRRRLLALGFIIAAIAIKPIAIVVAPFLVLLGAAPHPSYGRRFVEWSYLAVATVVVLGGAGWAMGIGFGWFTAALGAGSAVFQAAPVGLLGFGIGELAGWLLSVEPGVVASWVYTGVRVISMVVTAVLLLMPRMHYPVVSGGYALLVVILASSVIQPWYALWVLPLFAVAHVYRGRILSIITVVITVMTLLALTGQLWVAPWLDQLLVRGIAIAVAAVYLLYIVFLDPNTRSLFRLRGEDRHSQRWNELGGWVSLRDVFVRSGRP